MSTETDNLYKVTYEGLKSAQGKRSLEAIKKSCDSLERHSKPINANTVAAEARAQGNTIAASSIRNSKAYMEYIKARADQAKLKEVTASDFQPLVTDPTVEAYINVLKGKLNQAEAKNRAYKQYLETRVDPLDVDKFLAEQDPTRFGHLMPKEEPKKLEPPASVVALPQELQDPEHLAKFGLEIVRGRVVSKATGEVLVKL